MGADPAMTGTWLDYTGTPLDFARQYKHNDIIALFREYDEQGKVTSTLSNTNSIKNRGKQSPLRSQNGI